MREGITCISFSESQSSLEAGIFSTYSGISLYFPSVMYDYMHSGPVVAWVHPLLSHNRITLW